MSKGGPLTVFLLGHSESQQFEIKKTMKALPPHPYIAPVKYCGEHQLPNERVKYTTKNHCKFTLRQFIHEHEITPEWIKCVAIQIAHGIRHLHENDEYLDTNVLDSTHVSEDEKHVVIEHQQHNEKDGLKKKEQDDLQKKKQGKDIRSLRSFLKDILLKVIYVDKSDEEISADLIYRMEEWYTCVKVLQHPFFWTTDKKLNFLCISGQIIAPNENLKKRLNDKYKEIGQDGWKECLKIGSIEKREIKKELKAKGKYSDDVSEDTILNLSMEGRTAGDKNKEKSRKRKHSATETKASPAHGKSYDYQSTCDLLRFIRNRKAHFRNDSNLVRMAFRGNDTEGIWNFFSRRFPKLLDYVWQTVYNTRPSGFEETYFKQIAFQTDLPTLPKIEHQSFAKEETKN